MLALLSTLLGAIVSGGATGLLGVVIQRFFDMKSKSQDLELLKVNNTHALNMADKQLAQTQAEWAARKDIATTEAGAVIAAADRDLAAREAEAAALVQAESYQHDKASYLTGAVLRSKSRFVLWSMAVVDAVRGAIRPLLTAYLVVMTHGMYADMQKLLAQYGVQLPVTVVQELLLQITATILYLATVAVVWWFGTRPPAQARKSASGA